MQPKNTIFFFFLNGGMGTPRQEKREYFQSWLKVGNATNCFLCCKCTMNILVEGPDTLLAWHTVSLSFQLFGRLPFIRLCSSSGECCGKGGRQEQGLCLPVGGER